MSWSKGLCNNSLEGGWKMGEICPKTKSYPPSHKAKFNFNPPSHNDNIKANPSPPLPLKIVSSHWFPHTQLYLLDFFLRYKHHFKWLFDVCSRVIRRVIRITGLWACVVFAWIGRFLIFLASLALRFPRAWVRTQEFLSDWAFFFFFEAQFNHTVFYLPYFKFVSLLKFQQLGFSFC